MTTMDRDSTANLGILAMFDSMFRPAATLAAQPDEAEEDFPACVDCGDELVGDGERCSECAEEFERAEADNYRAIYREDSEPRICGNLYDGR